MKEHKITYFKIAFEYPAKYNHGTIKGIAILFFIFLMLSSLVSAQKLDWVKSIGGLGEDSGIDIEIDGLGNIYTLGLFSETVDFDPNADIYNITAKGNNNFYLLKLDAQGDFKWVNQYEQENMYLFDMSTDKLGNVYLVGIFYGMVDFDPSANVYNLSPTGQTDMFIQKIGPQGNLLWVRTIGGYESLGRISFPYISTDASGYIYTTGRFRGTIDFNPDKTSTNLKSTKNDGSFTLKLDKNGSFMWVKSIIPDNTTWAKVNGSAIIVDNSGNVYTAGYFKGEVDFNPGEDIKSLNALSGIEIFIQKLDNKGNFLWVKNIDGNYSSFILEIHKGLSIATDNSENIYTTSFFEKTVDFDPSDKVYNLTSGYKPDIFIQKLDSKGNLSWVKSMGGDNIGIGQSIKIDDSDNIYTSGIFYDTVDFNPNSGVANLIAPWGGFFIQKLNQDGNLVWAKSTEAIFEGDKGKYHGKVSMVLNKKGDIYSCGSFYGTVDFDPNASITYLSAYVHDIFIQKLSAKNPLGIDPKPQSKIKLYPNPTNNMLNIELPASVETAQFSIINYMGQVVRQGNLNRSKKVVNLLNLSAGIYQVNMILSSGEKYFEKIVLTK